MRNYKINTENKELSIEINENKTLTIKLDDKIVDSLIKRYKDQIRLSQLLEKNDEEFTTDHHEEVRSLLYSKWLNTFISENNLELTSEEKEEFSRTMFFVIDEIYESNK